MSFVSRFRPLRVSLIMLVLSLALLPGATLLAQEAPPSAVANAPLLTALGLPNLEIIVSSEESILPTETVAGPQLLTVRNESEGVVVSSITLLPEGITTEEYLAAVNRLDIPEWVLDATIAGGFDQDPGRTSSAIIDLTPGTWTIALVSQDVEIANPAGTLTVTGQVDPAAADAVPADVTIGLGEYVFDIPDILPAGPQIWRIENTHHSLHHVIVLEVDRLYSPDEIVATLGGTFSGTPIPGNFDVMTAPAPVATSAISEGVSVWIETDLTPGYYVAFCVLPDPGAEAPHAFMGMVDSFEVVEG
jgi:hypothetical protein